MLQFQQLLGLILVQHHGFGRGHLVGAEQVCQVDLVGAAQNGAAVIDSDQVLALGFFGEAVGVMIDVGGGADEQAIELGQAQVSPAGE